MRTITFYLLALTLLLTFVAYTVADDSEKTQPLDTSDVTQKTEGSESVTKSDQVFAYYLHGNARCVTCKKLEAYSLEALETGFADELADSSVVWRAINYDEDENKHYIDDYKLYTKTLILSREIDGKQVNWKNADKIWNLVRDKEKFVEYVQSETRAMIDAEVE